MEKKLINEGVVPQIPRVNVADQAIPQETKQVNFGLVPQISQPSSTEVGRNSRETFEEAIQRRSARA